MKIKVRCDDKYEAKKLYSLLFIKDQNETFIKAIINIFNKPIYGEKIKRKITREGNWKR